MANTKIDYNLIVFDVRDPDLTYVYIRIDPVKGDPMDCDYNIFGWHGKAYPARKADGTVVSTRDLMDLLCTGKDHDPLFWPKLSPIGL